MRHSSLSERCPTVLLPPLSSDCCLVMTFNSPSHVDTPANQDPPSSYSPFLPIRTSPHQLSPLPPLLPHPTAPPSTTPHDVLPLPCLGCPPPPPHSAPDVPGCGPGYSVVYFQQQRPLSWWFDCGRQWCGVGDEYPGWLCVCVSPPHLHHPREVGLRLPRPRSLPVLSHQHRLGCRRQPVHSRHLLWHPHCSAGLGHVDHRPAWQ